MERIAYLHNEFRNITQEENVVFVDTCQILSPVFKYLSGDGIHLNADGQRMIALIIQENLKFHIGN